jgi:tetratricopeptide (TPR) repeat protein
LLCLLQNGEFDQVSELLRTHLPTDEPQSGVITQVNIGSIQLWQGDYVGAIESFEAAATEMEENTPRQARTLALLGMALYGDKKFEEANQAYLRSLTMLRTRKEGYGCYNLRHEFVMGQIFNCVGCSFYETGFHKSASRSFLNALHVYLQDIVDADMTTEESQSVEFVLTRVKENKNWTSHIPPPFVLDTAICFANLACVLINRNSLNQAISCLRLSLKVSSVQNKCLVKLVSCTFWN